MFRNETKLTIPLRTGSVLREMAGFGYGVFRKVKKPTISWRTGAVLSEMVGFRLARVAERRIAGESPIWPVKGSTCWWKGF